MIDTTSNTATTGGGTPMGENGKAVSGAGPNTAGPAVPAPESQGSGARDQGDLKPFSVA